MVALGLLLMACVGGGTGTGDLGGALDGGPGGPLGGLNQAAPEMDPDIPVVLVDHNPCAPFFEGSLEEVSELADGRRRVRMTGYVFLRDSVLNEKADGSVWKECGEARRAEAGRVIRLVNKTDQLYLETILSENVESNGTLPGYVDVFMDLPATGYVFGFLAPNGYFTTTAPETFHSCPGNEACLEGDGWENLFIPPSLGHNQSITFENLNQKGVFTESYELPTAIETNPEGLQQNGNAGNTSTGDTIYRIQGNPVWNVDSDDNE